MNTKQGNARIVVAVIVGVLVVGGLAYVASIKKVDVSSDWETYSNSSIEFKYPPTFTVEEKQVEPGTESFLWLIIKPKANHNDYEEISVEAFVDIGTIGWTFKDLKESEERRCNQVRSDVPPACEFISASEIVTQGGEHGIVLDKRDIYNIQFEQDPQKKTIILNGSRKISFISPSGGDVYGIRTFLAPYGDPGLALEIAKTFRFTK